MKRPVGQDRDGAAGAGRDTPPVIVVTGPTACGKSGFAAALAEDLGGVVVNGDSMQVYRELRILTARPGPRAEARAPHRLYGVLSGREVCSAGRWRAMAVAEIEAAHRAGLVPIVVGGTGLYLRALEAGLAPVPQVPDSVRAAARARHAALGGAGLHAALAARDPAMAARLGPTDTQRLIRAWEVLEATGRSLAEWQEMPAPAGPAPYRFLRVVALPPRPALYGACDARLCAMIEQGALDEVRALAELGLDPALPVMKALGVPPFLAHLAGRMSLDEARARAQRATRNYAKRQMTWLRTQIPRDDGRAVVLNKQFSESSDQEIFSIIRRFVLTA